MTNILIVFLIFNGPAIDTSGERGRTPQQLIKNLELTIESGDKNDPGLEGFLE